ncbi:MAG: peptide chain release factor N(5)-glutamine methyltransferase [Bacilli bacterium]|nr:peptide chain release factor N(5)-glutamine methyltransferase [Bacilli bacterium]
MPTISEAIKTAYEETKEYGVMPVDLRLLIMHNEGLKEQIDVLANKDKPLEHYDLFREQVERLKNNEPVEYIIHEASFLERRLYVDENVLIPRGETEELIANLTEIIDDYYDARNYLVCADIGTGSGCIAIGIKDYFPNWLMLASDISPKALEVAKKNFQNCGINVTTYEGDALEPYIKANVAIDVIVANPPYILNKEDAQASVRDFEPASALWLDKENSVYEKIFRDCHKVKKDGLLMIFEISPDLEDYLKDLMKTYLTNYTYKFMKDLNKMTRFLVVNCK